MTLQESGRGVAQGRAPSGHATHPYADVGSDSRRFVLNEGSSRRFKNTLAMSGRSSSTAASF